MKRRAVLMGAAVIVILVAVVTTVVWRSNGADDAADAADAPMAQATPPLTGPTVNTTDGQNPAGEPGGMNAPTLTTARASEAVCRLSPAQITRLAGTSTARPAAERLRDAVTEFEERLDQLQIAEEGRPELTPVVSSAEDLLTRWRTALTGYDRGRTPEAEAALADAPALLATLTTRIDALPSGLQACT